MGFRVRVSSLGFRVWGLGFGVWGLGFGVWGWGFGVWGFGIFGVLEFLGVVVLGRCMSRKMPLRVSKPKP